MGVATGCGCEEVYRFPHTTYPYSSCIYSFLQQHPYFLFILINVFYKLLIVVQKCINIKFLLINLVLQFPCLLIHDQLQLVYTTLLPPVAVLMETVQ